MTEFVAPGTRFFALPSPFPMKRGGALHQARLAYETWGTLNPPRDNAILILTGLSPSAHAASHEGNPEPGWWEPMIGPGSTGTVGKLRMKGQEVFRHAVSNLASVLGETLAKADLSIADVDWVVPHQANRRIIDATAKKLGLPAERVLLGADLVSQNAPFGLAMPIGLTTGFLGGFYLILLILFSRRL